MQLFLKILSGMATLIRLILDEQSDLSLHCLHMQFGQKLWYTNFRTLNVSYYMTPYETYQVSIFISQKKKCCGYSLEALHLGASKEYHQHIFLRRNKKISTAFCLNKVPNLELCIIILDHPETSKLKNRKHLVKTLVLLKPNIPCL